MKNLASNYLSEEAYAVQRPGAASSESLSGDGQRTGEGGFQQNDQNRIKQRFEKTNK